MKTLRSSFCVIVFACLCFIVEPATAQNISTDGSVGPKGTLLGPNYIIPAQLGQTRGSNLFHSFSTFSVLGGESANFTGPTTVQSIFSRVTGGSVSNINGLLTSTIPGVNLFLLNPAGVLFGPNASVNIGGSFRVSTADYIRFIDGYKFSTTLGADGNFTSAPYAAFGFLGPTAAPITFDRSTIEVKPGQTLAVVGGNITLNGPAANGENMLQAKSGEVHVVSVASAGEVPIVVPPGPGALPMNQFTNLGTITLTNNARIAAPPTDGNLTPGGRILMRGGKLVLDQGSAVFASTGGNLDAPPVAMDIQMREAVVLDNGSALSATNVEGTGNGGDMLLSAASVELKNNSSLNTFYLGNGKGSDLVIDTGTLSLTNSRIEASSFGAVNSGNGGAISIRATEQVNINPTSLIQSLNFQGTGSASPISITTPSLNILGGSIALTGIRGITGGNGPASAVTLNVGTLEITGNNALIDTRARNLSVTGTQLPLFGGGPITIQGQGGAGTAADLVHISGTGAEGGLLTKTEGRGTGGAISITANRVVMDSGGLITATTESIGSAGTITLNVDSLEVTSGATIEGSTTGAGAGGTVIVQGVAGPAQSIFVDGANSGFFSTTSATGAGGSIHLAGQSVTVQNEGTVSASTSGLLPSATGGTITVNGSTVQVNSGATITAQSTGQGDAGAITLSASDVLSTSGGIVTSSALSAKGGNITMTAPTVTVAGGSVTAETAGAGQAGSIVVNGNTIGVSGGAELSSSSTGNATGAAGTVTLQGLAGNGALAQSVTLNNGKLLTSATGSGAGGDILVRAPAITLTNNASISATTNSGNAGSLTLTDAATLNATNSSLTTESTTGRGGSIDLAGTTAINLTGTTVSATVKGGSEAGGNITMTAPTVMVAGGRVTAETAGAGPAGSIQVDANTISVSGGTELSSSSTGTATGAAGTVTLQVSPATAPWRKA